MDLGIAVIGVIAILMFVVPVVLLNRSKSNKKQSDDD